MIGGAAWPKRSSAEPCTCTHAVMASGAADFEAAPGRELFREGEAGAEEHERAFNEYIDGNFDDAGAEVRSLDQRDRKVGLFGDWMEAAGHG